MHAHLADVSRFSQCGDTSRAVDGRHVSRLATRSDELGVPGCCGRFRGPLAGERTLFERLAVRTGRADVRLVNSDGGSRESRDRQLIVGSDYGADDHQNQAEQGCRQQPTTVVHERLPP